MFRAAIAATAFALAALPAVAQDRWMSIPPAPPMPEAVESGMAEVNGISMHYAVFGPEGGIPLLFIHGGLGHADLWSPQVADLMTDTRVIVADTRGHGRSTNDGTPHSYDVLTADYLALLDHLGVEKAAIVGWSDGGIIGLNMAATHPERVDRLFAHAANVTLDGIDPSVNDDEVFGSYIGAMAEDYARLSPTPGGFDEFIGGVAAMWDSEKEGGVEALTTITVPVTIVHGQYDEAIRQEHSEMMAATIPGARLVILPEVSHFANLQAPEEYTAAIREFLAD